jgi:hypothetical protein
MAFTKRCAVEMDSVQIQHVFLEFHVRLQTENAQIMANTWSQYHRPLYYYKAIDMELLKFSHAVLYCPSFIYGSVFVMGTPMCWTIYQSLTQSRYSHNNRYDRKMT